MVSFAPFFKSTNLIQFWQFNGVLFLAFAFTTFCSHIIFILYAALLASIAALFEVKIQSEIYSVGYFFAAFILNTIIFLSFIPGDFSKENDEVTFPHGLKVLTSYIGVPFILIYLCVLYLYLGKIILTSVMPKGLVGWLVCGFSVFGLLTWLLLYPLRESSRSTVRFFLNNFFKLLLPLLCLLFVAVFTRVSRYGLTERRYFLIVLGLWLVGVSLYLIFAKIKNIKIIPISLFLLAVFSAFGPWSAYQVSLRNQYFRLKGIFSEINVNPSSSDNSSRTTTSTAEEFRISQILKYILDTHGVNALTPIFSGNTKVQAIIDKNTSEQKRYGHWAYSYDRQQVATDIMHVFGMKYLHYEFQTKLQEYFNYSINKKLAINVSGIKLLIPSQTFYSEQPSRIEYNGKPLTLIFKDNQLFAEGSDSKQHVISIKDLVTRLQDERKIQRFQDSSVPQNLMSFELTVSEDKLVFLFEEIGGFITENQSTLNRISVSVLVK